MVKLNLVEYCKQNNLSILDEWDYELNLLGPENYNKGSYSMISWVCGKNKNHKWEKSIRERENYPKCPYCSGIRACEENNFLLFYPELCKEWSDKNTTKPNDFLPKSNIVVWWQCLVNENHDWQAPVSARSIGYNYCPKCNNDLLEKFPYLAEQWHHLKNKDKPENYSCGSNEIVWWQCEKSLEHEWQSSILNRANGNGCPYCSNKKVCSDNNLTVTNPNLVLEWDYEKNDCKPEEFTKGSGKKIHWICLKDNKHKWPANISTRQKHGCPFCRKTISKQEDEWLISLNNSNIQRQYRIKINNKRTVRVDGFDETTNTIYQFHGDYWHGNPDVFNPNDFNKKVKETFGELYKYTIEQDDGFKAAGYNVIIMWGLDWENLNKGLANV